MRNIQSIVSKDLSHTLYYFTRKVEIKNAVGKVSATLTEYVVSADEDIQSISYTLYKTSEGFWYDKAYVQDKTSNRENLL